MLIEKKRYELEHRPVQKQVCCTTCALSVLGYGTVPFPQCMLCSPVSEFAHQVRVYIDACSRWLDVVSKPCTRFALQYVVETKYVGEQAVQGAPTEVVGNESKIVDEHIKQAPAGDRTVVVENVDVPGDSVRTLSCSVCVSPTLQ